MKKLFVLVLAFLLFACEKNTLEEKDFADSPAKKVIWKAAEKAGGYKNWISKKNAIVNYSLGRYNSLSEKWNFEAQNWQFELGEKIKVYGEFDEKESKIIQVNNEGKFWLQKDGKSPVPPVKTDAISEGEFNNLNLDYLRQIEITQFGTLSNKTFLSAPFNLIDQRNLMAYELLPEEEIAEGIKTIPIKVTFNEKYPYSRDWFVYYFNKETYQLERVFFEYVNFNSYRGYAEFSSPKKFENLELPAKRTYFRSNLNRRKALARPTNTVEINSFSFTDELDGKLFQH
ncbi:hypothetical protein IT568_12550 [bacterium]|nr:hypothetical protein [bacterium]